MGKEFDGKLLMSNIEYLLDKKNMKFNKLEENAGISAGYISRVKKDPSNSKPSVEFAMKIADALEINLDTLVKVDLKSLTATEDYLLKFIDKLIKKSMADELLWERETEDYLDSGLKIFDNGNTSHPLIKLEYFEGDADKGIKDATMPVFTSDSFGVYTYIIGDCFNLEIGNGTFIYLMNIARNDFYGKFTEKAYAKELWIFHAYDIQQCLCSTTKGALALQVESLYNAVSESMQRPKISEKVRSRIEFFMTGGNCPPSSKEEAE